MKRAIGFFRGIGRLLALSGVTGFAAAAFVLNPTHRRTLAGRARWLQRTCRLVLHVLGVRWSSIGPR
ncbi:MAG: hypothetical protein ABIR80_19020, partial [Opitutaceae bacterium]